MIELTPALVMRFADHMTTRFDAKIVSKAGSFEMWFVSRFLQVIGVLDANRFMNSFATTIGNRIYLPFEVGDTSKVDLWSQVVTITHECQHVHQCALMGSVAFVTKYLGSSAGRTALEVGAYTTLFELEWWAYRNRRTPSNVASKMKDYGVSDADVKVAAVSLQSIADAVWAGCVVTAAGLDAIEWFDQELS